MCEMVWIPCDKEHSSGSDGLWLAIAGAAVVMAAQALWWLTVKLAKGVRWAAPRVWRVSVRLVRWARRRRAERVQRARLVRGAARPAIAAEAEAGVLWSEVSAKKPANA